MDKILKAFLMFATTQLVCSGAFAACGGGGNHANAPAAAPVNAVAVSTAPAETVELAVVRPMPVAITPAAPSFNTVAFDSISPALNLTKSQQHDLADAKSDIRDQEEKLAKANEKAQAKLAKCHGDCQDKAEKADQTAQAFNSHNPNGAFDAKLSQILSASQYRLYTERAHAKSTVSLNGMQTRQQE